MSRAGHPIDFWQEQLARIFASIEETVKRCALDWSNCKQRRTKHISDGLMVNAA